jgi:tRNA G18 (ribose-2'-O)-methylase SpoU
VIAAIVELEPLGPEGFPRLPERHAELEPLLTAFTDARDRDLRGRDRRFLVESPRVVPRFLRSEFACEAVLTTPAGLAAIEPALARRPDRTTVFLVEEVAIDRLSGYRFHGGMLALGVRPFRPPPAAAASAEIGPGPATLLAAEGVVRVDNVGALFRNAACLGARGVLLDHACADPLLRKAIRFSTGRVFDLPWGVTRDEPDALARELRRLRDEQGFRIVAAETGPRAKPLGPGPKPERVVLVVGAETSGLSAATLDACDEVVAIPMAEGDADDPRSLNVAAASAIMLYAHAVAGSRPAAASPARRSDA